MSLLSATKITCIKKDRTLFEDFNFAIDEHQIIHLKGENGAGKTSLLRILAGLSLPNSGQVLYKNNALPEHATELAAHSLYIGHKSSINGCLTAVENTKFWLAQQGIAIDLDKIDATLYDLGLAGFEDIPVRMLSAGQQRRVALTRLWLKPQAGVWLLDEPFTALDTKGINIVNDAINEFSENGGAIVLTSHQPLIDHPNLHELQLEYRF